jgi:hypothetical protein
MNCLRTALVIGMIMLPMACAHQPETAHKPQPTDEKPPMLQEDVMDVPLALNEEGALSSAVFGKQVAETGGSASFVFEDDRPFAQCHASTITQAPDGGILTAWFAGTKEKHSDVGIWISKCTDGVWSAPGLAAKVEESAHWNPVLFTDAAGIVYLFFKVGPEIPQWRTWWMQSADSGATWTKADVARSRINRSSCRMAPGLPRHPPNTICGKPLPIGRRTMVRRGSGRTIFR